jgi:hypothetical protein
MNLNLLPDKIKDENIDLQNNKIKLEKIYNKNFSKISTIIEKIINVDQNSSESSNIFFIKGIKNTYTSNDIAASSVVTYSNFLNITSSSTISSIYEYIRSYVYRPIDWPNYISSNKGPYIISSSTTGLPTLPSICGALTGIRTIFFNRKLIKDSIKSNTVRISISPINTTLLTGNGLKFNNNVDDSSAGKYASITGMAGLSGSLSAGVSGKSVTAFTIAIKFKPINSGSNIQTLLHRRIADVSLSSLDFINGPTDSKIITEKYINLNPLSAITTIISGTDDLSLASIIWSFRNTIPATNTSATVINLVNKGGGQLKWAISSQSSMISISSAMTSSTIFGISNLLSTTASITAYSLPSISSHSETVEYLLIYNTSLEKCPNLPLAIPITLQLP